MKQIPDIIVSLFVHVDTVVPKCITRACRHHEKRKQSPAAMITLVVKAASVLQARIKPAPVGSF